MAVGAIGFSYGQRFISDGAACSVSEAQVAQQVETLDEKVRIEMAKNEKLKAHVRAVTAENQALKYRYQEIADSITLAQSQYEEDPVVKRCIETALYISKLPYTEEGERLVEELKELTKDTPEYGRYGLKGKNVVKQKPSDFNDEDAREFVSFLKTFQGANFKVKQGVYFAPDCQKYLSALRALPVFQKYKNSDDLEESYLGKMILHLEMLLVGAVNKDEAIANQILPTAGKYGKELTQFLK